MLIAGTRRIRRPVGTAETPPRTSDTRFNRAYGTRTVPRTHPPVNWRATIRGPYGTDTQTPLHFFLPLQQY